MVAPEWGARQLLSCLCLDHWSRDLQEDFWDFFNTTPNISGFLTWTPLGLLPQATVFPTPTCPRLVCPGHLGKHLGTAGPGWVPTLQAGGTLQFEQCVPSRSLELGPVYFLRGMMARKPFQNQQANFSF